MPQQPIAEQLKDFVGEKPVQYTRQELPPHLFDCLSEDDPALCVSGDLMDLVSEQDGQKTVLTTLHQEALKRKYDIVLQYDPATNKITLVEELLGAGNSHRTKLEEVDLKVLDVSGNNLVPVMLEQSTIIPAHGFSPDRTALEIFKQAQRLGLKICLFINNADIFFGCTGDKFGGSISAPERPLNPRIITDFISYLRGTEGCHLIFADPKGKVTGEMQNEMPFHHVPLTTSEEIRGLLGKVIDLNQHPGAIPLAAGTSLRELQKRIKDLNGAPANEVIGLLKKFKEDQIVALAGGAVKCSLDHYDDDMVAMPDKEKEFWTELAQILEVGGEELPQGCILVGPPGTGKSVRARYMASAMGVPFLELRDISSSGLRGLKEDKLRAALEAAIRVKPCILFIDEIDKKLPRTEGSRNGDSSENDDAEVAAMLQTLLDSKEMKGVFIIGAANDPGEMNEAMLRNGRFGLRVACLPPQNTKEKIKVFRAVFAQVNSLRGETVPDEIIEFIVNSDKLSGASGADYYELIRRTAIKWQTKKSTQTLGATLIECLEKFTFRINERTKIMTEKAIEMHTADFDLFEPHDTNPDPQIDTLYKLEAAIIAANERAARYEDLILNSQQALDALKLELQAKADNERRMRQSEHKTTLDALANAQKDLEKAQKALEKKEAEIDKTIAQKTDQALAAERAQLAQERELLSKAEKALKRKEDQIDETIAQKTDKAVAAERAELLKEKANLAKERKRFEADNRRLSEKEARLETIISERAAAMVAPERTLIAQERAQIAQEVKVRRSKIETENQEFIDGPVKDLYKKYTPTIPWQVIRASLMVHPGKISALKAMIKRGGNPRFTSADHNQFEIIGGPFDVRDYYDTDNKLETFASSKWLVEEAIAAAQHMGEIDLVSWCDEITSDLRAQIQAANLHCLNLVEDITFQEAQKRAPLERNPKPFTYIDAGERRYLFVSHNQGNSPYGWIGAINVPCHFGFENEEDKVTEKLSKIMEGLKKRGVRAKKQQEKTQEVNWQTVEIALKKAPLLLASVYNMENLGLNPQVFAINPNNFSIAGAGIIPRHKEDTTKNLPNYMIENGIPPMTTDRYNKEYGPIRISEFDNGWLDDSYPTAVHGYYGLITGEILIPGDIRKK